MVSFPVGSGKKDISPFSIPNIRLFIAFRVLFNSRFYYPVFTILFLDFGLTVAQFSILNAAWAATIVIMEVPSGALADLLGRKRLLVFASAVMVVEIGIISFVPRVDPSVIFVVFLINRILSGLAEAAASGADEAMAYDSLLAHGNKEDWGRVLDQMMRYRAMGFIFAMTVGAAVYDPDLMGKLISMTGFDVVLSQSVTMRFPLYLTFIMAILSLGVTLMMTEVTPDADMDLAGAAIISSGEDKKTEPIAYTGKKDMKKEDMKRAFQFTLDAGRWILRTPFVLWVMMFGMLFDGIIRMTITLSSQYYRLVAIPESLFGVIGSLVAMLGLVIPRLALKIVENRSPGDALAVTSVIALAGLFGMGFFWPYFGIIPAVVTSCAMYFNGFFVSYYLNRETSSKKRATVLSFKGLIYNISYGGLGVLYALILRGQKSGVETRLMDQKELENIVFMDAFLYFPWLLTAGLALMVCFLFFNKKSS